MQTKDKILLAFKDLSQEKGFYDATVDELALRSRVSKRTIYRYFNSKEEIIEEVMFKFIKETEQAIDGVLNSSEQAPDKIAKIIRILSERLKGLNPRVLRDLQRHYPIIWEKVEQFRAGKLKRMVTIVIEEGKEGSSNSINPTVATASLLATVRAVVNPTFMIDNNLTPEEAIQNVMHIFLYGLTGAKREF
ncbi:TetR/AcrR family transcriptional regulator [Desulforamulus aquiferis]|uniref:TetR/AcrR family transcriptional regulator n=1 Tax=Desulforamulus aquiferis TaxID=1397668 RepID=A0AAW7ZBJ3_9FIRM|nr:TetR/AcrR family transcriptional regulator [Desulforamulus aquiferis]MDO7786716.1 TetR/AcrR family transcriptional regulator [Desulforamulus aquiferis]